MGRTALTTSLTLAFALAVPGAAHARPADVTIVNPQPIPVTVSGTPTVKLDGSANAVRIDPSANDVRVEGEPTVRARETGWTNYVELTPTTNESRKCQLLPMPASGRVMLQTVLATTYYSPTAPTVYLLPFVKKGSTGRIMHMRIPLTTSPVTDPSSNVRYGSLTTPFIMRGGGFSAADIGEAYAVNVCTTNVIGEVVEVSLQFNGVQLG